MHNCGVVYNVQIRLIRKEFREGELEVAFAKKR